MNIIRGKTKISLGGRSEDGKSLVRDTATFKRNFDEIDWSKRQPSTAVVRRHGGRVRYVYGKAQPDERPEFMALGNLEGIRMGDFVIPDPPAFPAEK